MRLIAAEPPPPHAAGFTRAGKWWPAGAFLLAALASVLLLDADTNGLWWRSAPAFAAAVLVGWTYRTPATALTAVAPVFIAIPFSNSNQSIPLVVLELFLTPIYAGLVVAGIALRTAMDRART